jgi:hypothetical protein
MKRLTTHYVLASDRSKSNQDLNESFKGPHAVSPSESVIRNLLNYSKALAVLKTHDSGYVNLVMN